MKDEMPAFGRRDRALDSFRGLAVLAMVIANFLADKAIVPPPLKHAPDIGFTVIDLIAPLFVVAMAVPFRDSYLRKLQLGGRSVAIRESLRRYLALIGIGAILSAGQSLALPIGGTVDWGVLQALGVAGLGLLCVVELPAFTRLAIGGGLLTAYQFLMPWTAPLILARSHGGLIGSISWMAMVIIGEGLWDLVRRRSGVLRFGVGALLAASGVFLSYVAPISKNRVSASYVVISLGISLFILALFEALPRVSASKAGPLEIWGKRPLALYLAHQMALALFVLPDIPWWHEASPLWLLLVQLSSLLVILTTLAYFMERRSLQFKL